MDNRDALFSAYPMWFTVVLALCANTALAQGESGHASLAVVHGAILQGVGTGSTIGVSDRSPETGGGSGVSADPAVARERSATSRFVHDLLADFGRLASKDPALWLGVGTVPTLVVHHWDEDIVRAAADVGSPASDAFAPGNAIGNAALQMPAAVAAWGLGLATHHDTAARFGRDLLQAQVVSGGLATALKVITQRERPNGYPRAFPSGHASLSFASASEIQRTFGWKAGVPAFALACYVGAARVVSNEHWTSDVVYGAAVGVASAHTIRVRHGTTTFAVDPMFGQGRVGVQLALE